MYILKCIGGYMKNQLFSEKSYVDDLLKKGEKFPLEFLLEPGVLIKLLRTRLGMTQVQLAKRSGVSQTSIANLEAGKKDPAIKTFRKLLEAMGFHLGFVPISESTVDRFIQAQAVKKAESNLDPILSTMAFEDQTPSGKRLKEMVREEANRLIESEPARIWDE